MAEVEASADATGAGAGFVERVGAALIAPKFAARVAMRPDRAGRAPTDVVLLVLCFAIARHFGSLATGGWILVDGEIFAGLSSMAVSLVADFKRPLIALLIAGAAVFAAAGRARSAGRDFDVATVAYIPVVFVEAASWLVFTVADYVPSATLTHAISTVAYGWGAVALIAGVLTIRGDSGGSPPAAEVADGA